MRILGGWMSFGLEPFGLQSPHSANCKQNAILCHETHEITHTHTHIHTHTPLCIRNDCRQDDCIQDECRQDDCRENVFI
jgi:hypothetical protein